MRSNDFLIRFKPTAILQSINWTIKSALTDTYVLPELSDAPITSMRFAGICI